MRPDFANAHIPAFATFNESDGTCPPTGALDAHMGKKRKVWGLSGGCCSEEDLSGSVFLRVPQNAKLPKCAWWPLRPVWKSREKGETQKRENEKTVVAVFAVIVLSRVFVLCRPFPRFRASRLCFLAPLVGGFGTRAGPNFWMRITSLRPDKRGVQGAALGSGPGFY